MIDSIDGLDTHVREKHVYPEMKMTRTIRLICAGLTITEFNPDHIDEDGAQVAAFIEGVVSAFARAK